MDLELVSATRQAGSTPSVHSFAPDFDDSGGPIRISSYLVGTGFEAVRTCISRIYPSTPKPTMQVLDTILMLAISHAMTFYNSINRYSLTSRYYQKLSGY